MQREKKMVQSYLRLALILIIIGFGLGADAGTQQKSVGSSKKILIALSNFEELPQEKDQNKRYKSEENHLLKIETTGTGVNLRKQLALSLEKSGNYILVDAASSKKVEAQILIQGKVLEYKPFRISPSNTTRMSSVSIREKDPTARVILEITLTDALTGQVIDRKKIVGEVKADEVSTAGLRRGLTFNLSGNLTTVSLEKASNLAVKRAMDWIKTQLSSWPWRSKIAEVNQAVLIRGDETLGFKIGDRFKVYRISKMEKPGSGSKYVYVAELKIVNFEKGFIKAENLGQEKPSLDDFVEAVQ